MQNYEFGEAEFSAPPNQKNFSPADELPVSPDNPTWGSWTALFVWLASVAFIVVVPSFLVLPYLIHQSGGLTDRNAILETAQKDPTAILLNILGVIPAHILTLLVAWLVVTRMKEFPFRETLGWRWNGFGIWNCLALLGGFYIVAAVTGYFYPVQENGFLRILQSSRTAVYAMAIMATFTAPLVEEVVYRGVLYSAFQKSFGVPLGVLLVTALFALVHVPQYYPSYTTIFLICLLSLVLTLIRVRTKNLLPCIALHTVFNGTQSLLMILQPYLENYLKIRQTEAAALLEIFK